MCVLARGKRLSKVDFNVHDSISTKSHFPMPFCSSRNKQEAVVVIFCKYSNSKIGLIHGIM